MKITHISIKNFKNIDSADYDLKDDNTFCGRNHIGKTNSILAIYWLITGYMLNGTADDTSLKQNKNKRNIVSVEATFEDGWKFRKDYYEKWTTPHGSAVSYYSGNITDYYINSVKINNNQLAISQFKEHMGVKDIQLSTNGKDTINALQAITNPLYLTEQIEWTLLRKLIISIVGDATPEDIFKTSEGLRPCEAILKTNRYDEGLAKQMIKNEIKELKAKNNSLVLFNKTLNLKPKVEAEELENAKANIIRIDGEIESAKPEKCKKELLDKIEQLKSNLTAKYNHEQENYSHNITLNRVNIENQLSAKQLERQKLYSEEYAIYESKLSKTNEAKNNLQHKLDLVKGAISNQQLASIQEKSILNDIESSKSDIAFYQQKLDYINSEKWDKDNQHKCPNCGYVLNKKTIDENKNQQLNTYTEYINRANKSIDNYNESLKDISKNKDTKDYSEDKAQLESDISALYNGLPFTDDFKPSDKLVSLDNEILGIKAKLGEPNKPYVVSQELIDKKAEIQRLVSEERDSEERFKAEYETNKTKLEAEKVSFENIKNQDVIYISAQRDISSNNIDIDKNNKLIGNKEYILDCLMEYSKIRLGILNSNVKKVFGESIRFKLLTENINGGWEPDCTPYIIGSDIEYKNGSPSEKLITSFNVMEKVKKALGEPDMPIVIDDCEKLDDFNAQNTFITKAQLIKAKVDSSSDTVKLVN